jgi:RND family efflux transporter MFP subunit
MVMILLIVVVASVVISKSKKKNPLEGMITTTAEVTTITQKISATGNVTAQTGSQINIGSQITGRIKRLHADVGTRLKAGDIIAELDLPDIKAQLDQAQANLQASRLRLLQAESGLGLQKTTTRSGQDTARANVASAQIAYDQAGQNSDLEINAAKAAVNQQKAALKQAQVNAKNALTSLKRSQQLLAKGYIAQQDVDNSQTQTDVAQQQSVVAQAQLESAQQNLNLVTIKAHNDIVTTRNSLNNARSALALATANTANDIIKAQSIEELKAQVKQAQGQVAYYTVQYEKTFIRTPIDATVVALAVQQGETVAAGLSAPTLISVVDLNRLQVDAYVDETDIGSVKLGQEATVTVDAYPNVKFKGRVVKIASGPTMQQNVVTYDTTIALEGTRGMLKPGMTATAEIVVGQRKDVVAVPIEAVKSDKSAQIVYVVRGEKITPHDVVTGISDDTMTEIIKGIKNGDTVVLAGYHPEDAGRRRMGLFGPMKGGGPK